jgi:L-ribulose-5-phosphate 3-epimerase
MQGRLSNSMGEKIQSFPVDSWKQEFKKAEKLGYEVIEWVFDHHDNPLLNSENNLEIINLSKKYDVKINSVCADYFMKQKLFHESENSVSKNIKTLEKLIIQSKKLGISMIEIPFVDSSSLKTENEKFELKTNIDKVIPLLEETGIILVLETDLPPLNFQNLLLQFDHPNILANYDSGNSASLGYNSKEELSILSKWIKNVHVKDRKFNGGTVPLGTGNTNFEHFFSSLSEINYSGDLIIQGARSLENKHSPEQTCATYQKFVNGYLNKYYK